MNLYRTVLFPAIILFFLSLQILKAQPVTDGEGDVGVGTYSPDPSAILDLVANDRGLLVPRLTTAERNAIANPAEGLIIYNTDEGRLEVWSNGSGNWQWEQVGTSGGGASGAASWHLDGNANTSPGENYVGTSDLQPLHIYVDSGRANALLLNLNASIQHSTGGDARGVGAVDLQYNRYEDDENVTPEDDANVASGDYSTVSGGKGNRASGEYSTVGGGYTNSARGLLSTVAGGDGSEANATYATVSGGHSNGATGVASTISGGQSNYAEDSYATIGGGHLNIAGNADATVGGGFDNSVYGISATISGGESNTVFGARATISGGQFNAANGEYSTISGGRSNQVSGRNSAILGGANLKLLGSGSVGFLADSAIVLPMTVAEKNTALFGNADLWLANNDGTPSELRFYESNATTGSFPGTTNYTSFVAGNQTANIAYTLPLTPPASDGVVLTSTTTGEMGWAAYLDLAIDSASFPTLRLGNSNDAGIALELVSGRMIVSTETYEDGEQIDDNVVAAIVTDNGDGSTAVVTLPENPSDGQILYITCEDDDGFDAITSDETVIVSVEGPEELVTLLYYGGTWHVSLH